MLHPDVVVDKSPFGGKGLFAQKKIPLGTIVWKWDENNERIYSNSQIQEFSKKYRHMILKYGNEYPGGKINYSTDKSKYWNHSCDPNTAPLTSVLFYMDIAIRDIYPGEEITFDYSLVWSSKWPKSFKCNCGTNKCRGIIPGFYSKLKIAANLQLRAKTAEKNMLNVKQPLLEKKEIKNVLITS